MVILTDKADYDIGKRNDAAGPGLLTSLKVLEMFHTKLLYQNTKLLKSYVRRSIEVQ